MSLGSPRQFPSPALRILTAGRAEIDTTWRWLLCDAAWRLYVNGAAGASLVFEDGSSIPIPPGRGLILPPFTPCRGEATATLTHTYLHFQVVGADQSLEERLAGRPHLLPDHPAWDRLQAIDLAAAVGQDWGPVFEALSIVHLALGLAWRQAPSATTPLVRTTTENPFLALARWIKVHGDASPTVTELAARMGLSRGHFTKRFTEEFGVHPSCYIAESRIRHAAGLLAGGTADIDAVARECGFTDRYHFSRVFKRVMGETPARFRRHAAP